MYDQVSFYLNKKIRKKNFNIFMDIKLIRYKKNILKITKNSYFNLIKLFKK